MASRSASRPSRSIVARTCSEPGVMSSGVFTRSPAALAGYELPMGLMGFPGVGWLFAGFPFTASILLLAGPALTWAVIPVAFSPYGRGPLRGVGWGAELVWLPVMALVSSAALYRAQARRRAKLEQSAGRLRALSPKATLERGYAIVRAGEQIVRSGKAVETGEQVDIELAEGGFGARVEETR
jgi:hypothetical protein